MIYIHTYYTGKFNSVKHVSVHQKKSDAIKQYEVLGGVVIEVMKARLILS
ncbi:hypothetical protein [Escherichia phage phiA2-1]|nr:hypothetical protein [Escherichia phage phiA2-1]